MDTCGHGSANIDRGSHRGRGGTHGLSPTEPTVSKLEWAVAKYQKSHGERSGDCVFQALSGEAKGAGTCERGWEQSTRVEVTRFL